MTKRTISLLALLTMLLISCLGGASSAASAIVSAKDTLIYAISTDISTLDIHSGGDLATQSILYNIYEPLVYLDAKGGFTNRLIYSINI